MKPQTKETGRVVCPDCDGSGKDQMDLSMACPFCDGEKEVLKSKLKGTVFDEGGRGRMDYQAVRDLMR